jgi:hypothetical protein
LFLLAPMLSGLPALDRAWLWLAWTLGNLPLLVVASSSCAAAACPWAAAAS